MTLHCPPPTVNSSIPRLFRGLRGGELRRRPSRSLETPVFDLMRVVIVGICSFVLFAWGCSSDRNPVAVVVPRDSVASYTVTFTSTWSATTHPLDFPASAHFSGLIGGTHSNGVVFWREGQLASPGIQAMAELGSKSPLRDEIAMAIGAGTARFELSGEGVRPSPGGVSLDFLISDSHPLVTLVSMIAPSPDWFVGVADLALLRNDRWVDSLTVELRGWDAGTDHGTTYAAIDAPAAPHVPIARLEDAPFKVNDQVPALGTYTFVRRQ